MAARNLFYKAAKNPMGSINEWKTRVHTLAIFCGFGPELDIVMRDMFISD